MAVYNTWIQHLFETYFEDREVSVMLLGPSFEQGDQETPADVQGDEIVAEGYEPGGKVVTGLQAHYDFDTDQAVMTFLPVVFGGLEFDDPDATINAAVVYADDRLICADVFPEPVEVEDAISFVYNPGTGLVVASGGIGGDSDGGEDGGDGGDGGGDPGGGLS